MKKKTMLVLLGIIIFLFNSCTLTDKKEEVIIQQAVVVEKPVEVIKYVEKPVPLG